MEQAQEARELKQVEEWVEEAVAGAGAAVAGDKVVVMRQARAVIVSVPTVAKEQPMSWEPPAMGKNAQNVAIP